MTTARERMLRLSPLVGPHPAREHFLAITAGTGATIFAKQMFVMSETQQMTLYRKPKRAVPQAAAPKPSAPAKKGSKNVYLMTERDEQAVITETEELWLVDLPKQVATVLTQPNEVFTSRRRAN